MIDGIGSAQPPLPGSQTPAATAPDAATLTRDELPARRGEHADDRTHRQRAHRREHQHDPHAMQDEVFSDRQYAGELVRDDLVTTCRQMQGSGVSSGGATVSLGDACDVLAGWDLEEDTGSRGALLFRRFWAHAVVSAAVTSAQPFLVPFSSSDPVHTPNTLNTALPTVRTSLADAVHDLQTEGVALDTPLSLVQFSTEGTERIPIPGGPGTYGDFNAINVGYDPAHGGYPDPPHGSSYVQVVTWHDATGCPDTATILTYGESANPTSPSYADQTRMFSTKSWATERFCAADVAAHTASSMTLTAGRRPGGRCAAVRRHGDRRQLGAQHDHPADTPPPEQPPGHPPGAGGARAEPLAGRHRARRPRARRRGAAGPRWPRRPTPAVAAATLRRVGATGRDLSLLGWRREVGELYAEARSAADPADGHAAWVAGRDRLFREHPDSPLPVGSPLRAAGLPVAPYDPAWRAVVPLGPAAPQRIEVPTGTDGVVPFERVGTLRTPWGDLDAWWLASYGGGLFVPLRDGSAGSTSYGGGRYLLDTVKGADLGGDGAGLVIDLNFSYHPSCRYDERWACPLAPPGNVWTTAVPVGEQL